MPLGSLGRWGQPEPPLVPPPPLWGPPGPALPQAPSSSSHTYRLVFWPPCGPPVPSPRQQPSSSCFSSCPVPSAWTGILPADEAPVLTGLPEGPAELCPPSPLLPPDLCSEATCGSPFDGINSRIKSRSSSDLQCPRRPSRASCSPRPSRISCSAPPPPATPGPWPTEDTRAMLAPSLHTPLSRAPQPILIQCAAAEAPEVTPSLCPPRTTPCFPSCCGAPLPLGTTVPSAQPCPPRGCQRGC